TYDWNTGTMQKLGIKRDYDFFNPKAGMSFEIGRTQRAFASWSVAHREPTRDNFIDCAPDRLPKAERMFDYELGYEYSGKVLGAGVNLYYMDYKDQLIPTGQLSDTGNPVSVNVPDSYRAGAELMLKLVPCDWFGWNFTTTLSRNRIKNFTEYIYEDEWTNPITLELGNTPIAFSPNLTLHNSFDFAWRIFDASLQSQYVSRQYLTNAGHEEQSLDPYFVTDLHLGCTLDKLTGVKNLRLGVSIYNLFSEKYENNGYAGAGYYMDGDRRVIYRYAGYAAQAPIHVMGSVALKF
ncbi:MAG: TonB-dependent receptor, partial [Muribaculaceae bacterium]|nr:TonB-dependent receptor [Muribaculaceae bacterium]